MYTIFQTCLCLTFVFACSGDSNPYSIVPETSGELTIMNATGRTIYHWAVEPEVLTVINYTLDTCPDRPGGSLGRIALWETRQLKLKDVYGYEPGKEVALIWWVLGRRLANQTASITICCSLSFFWGKSNSMAKAA